MSLLLDMFTYPFILRAFVVGILIALCAALLGVPLVLKRYSMIGDGLSHVSFGALSIALACGWAPLPVSIPVVVLAALGLHTRQAAPAAAKQPAPLSDTERRVLACIGPKPVGIEELCVSTGLPMSALLGTLMKLELTGRVYKQPGQRYVLR